MAGLIPLLLRPVASGSRASVIFPQTEPTTTTTTAGSPIATPPPPPPPTPPPNTSTYTKSEITENHVPRTTSSDRSSKLFGSEIIRTKSPTISRLPPRSSSLVRPRQSSLPPPPPPSSHFRKTHSPSPSCPPSLSPPLSEQSESESDTCSSRALSPARRMSQQQSRGLVARRISQMSHSSPPPALPVLPYTNAEWSRTIAEVKRQYLNRRYRPCSVRCGEILDNIKDHSTVEPTYLIYLHFYAASSLEMSARALQSASPYRTKLLQQARDHYRSAEGLMKAADSVARSSSRASSSAGSASLHSPAGSISSRAWTNSTELTSPHLSIYSLEDVVGPTAPSCISAPTPASKKRVTFSLSAQEPVIRPDSPTLGFDDYSLYCRPSAGDLETAPVAEAEDEDEDEAILQSHADHYAEEDAEDPFAIARSIHRYCGLLSSLRTELASHIVEVEAELAAPLPERSGRSTPDLAANSEELRSLEIRSRIERLRQNGWRRPRFNPKRYEDLRESVLAELA